MLPTVVSSKFLSISIWKVLVNSIERMSAKNIMRAGGVRLQKQTASKLWRVLLCFSEKFGNFPKFLFRMTTLAAMWRMDSRPTQGIFSVIKRKEKKLSKSSYNHTEKIQKD